jgi:hypothetical protein
VVRAASQNSSGGAALAETPTPVASLAPGQQAQSLTAADLAPITAISTDIRTQVQSGQQKGAKDRADDLESTWDDAAKALQAKNPGQWTSLDGQVDDVLSSVRAHNPDPAREMTAVNSLLSALPA